MGRLRLLGLLSIGWLFAASPASAGDSLPLFQSARALDITLDGPFRQIDRERDRDKKYDGSLSYTDPSGKLVTLGARFKVRGNYRLRKDVCSYSQLWVNLRRSELDGTLFEGQNKLKLVVQCKSADSYGDLVVREYLAYQLFNRLAEPGFDARLLNVTYRDSANPGSSRTQLGIFLENRKTLAKRYGLKEVDETRVPLSTLDPRQSTVVALFMYMIGNTDYSVAQGRKGEECCHNARLLDDGSHYLPVPYDFDGSGFVDAPYAAAPAPSLGIRSNRQRLFRGYCRHNDQVNQVLPEFRAARADLLATISGAPFSSARSAGSARDYVEDFYSIIDDPGDLKDDILDACRD